MKSKSNRNVSCKGILRGKKVFSKNRIFYILKFRRLPAPMSHSLVPEEESVSHTGSPLFCAACTLVMHKALWCSAFTLGIDWINHACLSWIFFVMKVYICYIVLRRKSERLQRNTPVSRRWNVDYCFVFLYAPRNPEITTTLFLSELWTSNSKIWLVLPTSLYKEKNPWSRLSTLTWSVLWCTIIVDSSAVLIRS